MMQMMLTNPDSICVVTRHDKLVESNVNIGIVLLYLWTVDTASTCISY